MVAAFDYCLHGKGGAAPVHRHRDARARRRPARRPPAPRLRDRAGHGRRRRGADQGVLRRPGGVGRLAPARLPARSRHRRGEARPTRRRSGSCSAATASRPGARPPRSARRTRWRSSGPRPSSSSGTARRSRSAPSCRATSRCPETERHAKAAALAPVIRGLASTDARQLGHYDDSDVVLEFLAREKLQPLAELGTSCPDHFLRTKVRPLVVDVPVLGLGRGDGGAAARAARGVPRGLRRLLRAARHPRQPADARRRPGDRAGARRRHVQLRQGQADRPCGRRVLRQRDQRDARRRGGVDVRTDRREREVPHRVLVAGGGQAAADAEAEAARRPGRPGHRRRVAASAGPSRSGWRPRVPAWWSRTSTPAPPRRSRAASARPTGRSP